jgi:hypothetical protein
MQQLVAEAQEKEHKARESAAALQARLESLAQDYDALLAEADRMKRMIAQNQPEEAVPLKKEL